MASFKPHKWDSTNKMHIDSEFKTFNKQCSLISTGNVWSDCQFSNYIRAWKNVKNGSYIGTEGEFLKYDLKNFQHVPDKFYKTIWDKGRTQSVILYEFRTWRGNQKDVFAYVMTDDEHNLIDYQVISPWGCNTHKRFSALYEILNYIVDGYFEKNNAA